MSIKLIALDLDGTLLDEQKQLPPNFYTIANYILSQGVRLVIASGRQYQNLFTSFAPIADKLTFMSENGALFFEKEQCLIKHPMPKEKMLELYHAALKIPTATPLLAGVRGCYINPKSIVEGYECEVAKYYESRFVTENAEEMALTTDEIVKIAMFDTESTEKNCLPPLDAYQDDFQISLSALHWIDIMPKGVNKGVTLSEFMKAQNLSRSECMAFGDYLNDMEMLDAVEYGYAMKNAHRTVLENARYVAPANTENGVIRVLSEYFPEIRPWVTK